MTDNYHLSTKPYSADGADFVDGAECAECAECVECAEWAEFVDGAKNDLVWHDLCLRLNSRPSPATDD